MSSVTDLHLIFTLDQPHSRYQFLFSPKQEQLHPIWVQSSSACSWEQWGQLFPFIIWSLFFTTTEKNIFKAKPNLEILSSFCLAQNIRITAFYEIILLYTIAPEILTPSMPFGSSLNFAPAYAYLRLASLYHLGISMQKLLFIFLIGTYSITKINQPGDSITSPWTEQPIDTEMDLIPNRTFVQIYLIYGFIWVPSIACLAYGITVYWINQSKHCLPQNTP